MDPNDMPLRPSIASRFVAPSSYALLAPRDRTPSQLYITDTLPCDGYGLTLLVDQGQRIRIGHFGFAPCPTSGDESQAVHDNEFASRQQCRGPESSLRVGVIAKAAERQSHRRPGSQLGPPLPHALRRRAALFMRRRQRSSSGPGSWLCLPGRGEPQSPSQPLLSAGGGIGGVKDRPRTRFGLYMFKFMPASGTLMRDPSSPPAMTEAKSATPGPAPAPPQGWFDPSPTNRTGMRSTSLSYWQSRADRAAFRMITLRA